MPFLQVLSFLAQRAEGPGTFHKGPVNGWLVSLRRAYSWTPVVGIVVLVLRQASRASKCYKPFIEQQILKVNWNYFKIPLGQRMDRMTDCYHRSSCFHFWPNCAHGTVRDCAICSLCKQDALYEMCKEGRVGTRLQVLLNKTEKILTGP